MKKLMITEKPSVAMDIAKVLGSFERQDGYVESEELIITWAVGHLVELAMPHDYDPVYEDWTLDLLPILPDNFKLKEKPQTVKQLKIIERLINRNDVDRLINACDAGREGELIFRYIIEYLNCNKPFDRLWLSETTPAAIRSAYNNLRSSAEVDNLAKAAKARSQADWLVGINATRGYTAKYCTKLTVGRVQTATLAMLVERERAINDFKPTPYWEIEAVFANQDDLYTAKWIKNKDNEDRFADRKSAEDVLSKLQPGSKAVVIDVQKEEISEKSPRLYNLTDLQKDANDLYGFTADQTLKIAQKLYEARLITYPRTDSRHISIDVFNTMPARLNALKGTDLEYLINPILATASTAPGKRYVDDSKVTDHTAIIFTDSKPDIKSGDERKIYNLIACRTIAMFYKPMRYMQTTIITQCQDEMFLSKGKTIIDPGWKIVMTDKQDDKNDQLPDLNLGQEMLLKIAEVKDKQTSAPARFTESSLLSAMQNTGRQMDEVLADALKDKGLGTPATRSAIIEKLISTGYVDRKQKALLPRKKGMTLIALVDSDIKNPELTGNWEKKLIEIEQGRYNPDQFMDEIMQYTTKIINDIKDQSVADNDASGMIDSIGNCPLCGKQIVENKKAYGCSGWRDEGCKFVIWKQIAGKKISRAQAKKIINTGRSDLIKGFKSKKGNDFDAYLMFDKSCDKITFKFPVR